MSSIRELLIQNVRSTLAGITVANGYGSEVTKVYEGEIDFDALTRGGIGIAFEDLEEDYSQKNANRLNRSLPIVMVGVVRVQPVVGDDAVRAFGRTLLADMEKALMADPTRGGTARDTLFQKSDIQSGPDIGPYVLVMLGIQVEYTTTLRDPSSH